MILSELIINNGIPQDTIHAFPIVLYCLRAAADGRDPIPFDVCYGAAGLLFTNLWNKNNTNQIFNTASLPTNIINSMDRLFSAAGFDYELASKWGGVYTEDYFLRRIYEHIRLNQPSIIFSSSPESGVLCIIGIHEKLKQLYVLKRNGDIIELNNWYKRLDSLLLIGRHVQESRATSSRNIYDIIKYSFSWVNNLKNDIHYQKGEPDMKELTYYDLFCNINIPFDVLHTHVKFLSECRNAAVYFLQRFLQDTESSGKKPALMEAIRLYERTVSILRSIIDDQIQYDPYDIAEDLDCIEAKAISLIYEVLIQSDSS